MFLRTANRRLRWLEWISQLTFKCYPKTRRWPVLIRRKPALMAEWCYSRRWMTMRTVQELLGHSDVRATMIYIHVLSRGGRGVQSPADRLLSGVGVSC